MTKNNQHSERFTLNENDWEKIFKNAAIFLAPAILIVLLDLQAGKDFSEAILSLRVWGLSTSIDMLRKFIAEK